MPTSSLNLGRTRLPLYLLIGFDLCLAIGAAKAAEYIRFHALTVMWPNTNLMAIQALLVIICSLFVGVYQPWRGRPLSERIGSVVWGWTLSFIFLTVFVVITKTAESYSRLWLAIWMAIGVSSAVICRLCLYSILTQLRKKGRNTRQVLILGSGINFRMILDEFSDGNDYGYNVTKVIHFESKEQAISELKKIIASGVHYDECWVCLPLKRCAAVNTLIHTMRHSTIDIRFMPGLSDIPLLNHKVTPIGGFYSLDISCSPLDGYNRVLKAIEDKIVGSLIFLLIAPVCAVIALAVKLSSPGPVLFKQYRHGADGKPIKVYKFRSMKLHNEKKGEVTQATKKDPRITSIGAFLRRTSLDELPQFFNVIQGKMSIVGPRPHALEHNEYYKDMVESYMKRHKVKPGITGLAQVRGYRGETDTLEKMQKRVECDLEYMNNWSLWLDLKIIFFTVFTGFAGKTAY